MSYKLVNTRSPPTIAVKLTDQAYMLVLTHFFMNPYTNRTLQNRSTSRLLRFNILISGSEAAKALDIFHFSDVISVEDAHPGHTQVGKFVDETVRLAILTLL